MTEKLWCKMRKCFARYEKHITVLTVILRYCQVQVILLITSTSCKLSVTETRFTRFSTVRGQQSFCWSSVSEDHSDLFTCCENLLQTFQMHFQIFQNHHFSIFMLNFSHFSVKISYPSTYARLKMDLFSYVFFTVLVLKQWMGCV